MNVIIIPSHNQGDNIRAIVKGYECQTKKPDLVLFIFDRCSDNSRQIFTSIRTNLNLQCVIKTEGENFSAGMTRDFGVDYVLTNYPDVKNIIFTDGDCIPCDKLVEIHEDCLAQTNKPALSCGRRIMKTKDGLDQDDERITSKWTKHYSFTDKNARLLISNRVTLNSILTYSCNIGFNKQAILLCRKINLLLSNSERVFNPEFDGSWGGEDNFISDCLYRTGNDILMCSKDCYVTHLWHEQSDKNNISQKRLIIKKLSNKLKDLVVNGDIPGDYTIFEKNRNIGIPSGYMNEELNNIKQIVKQEDSEVFSLLQDYIERYEIITKYLLSRNRVIIAANGNNPKKEELSKKSLDIEDELTCLEIYRSNNSLIRIERC